MTCASSGSSRRILPLFLLTCLLGYTASFGAAGEFGGTQSNYISGNEVSDLYFSPKDSNLFVLTGSGLSYTKWLPGTAAPAWYNFGAETFQSNFYFTSVVANHSTVFVTGYTYKP